MMPSNLIPTDLINGQTYHEVVWSLALGYGFKTTLDALVQRHKQIWGWEEGTIAGMAASAWFLANPQFLEGLPGDVWVFSGLSLALISLIRDDWQMSLWPGGRFYDSIGADDGFA